MKKILNKRLETLSAFIKDNESVIDIGCDHGLLGIYLMLNRENIKVISSDINSGPLEKAKDNLVKYHLENKIELRLGDGLKVMDDDVDTIIISGMGGINMINILEMINEYPKVLKLVLSPNNDYPLVRKSISQLGFKLNKEEMVFENGKYYPIMEFIKGHEKVDYYFGKLDLSNKVVREYFLNIYHKNKEILKKVHNEDLNKENKLIEENINVKE